MQFCSLYYRKEKIINKFLQKISFDDCFLIAILAVIAVVIYFERDIVDVSFFCCIAGLYIKYKIFD